MIGVLSKASVSNRSFTPVTINSLNAGPSIKPRKIARSVSSDTVELVSASVGNRPWRSSAARRRVACLGSSITSVRKLACRALAPSSDELKT